MALTGCPWRMMLLVISSNASSIWYRRAEATSTVSRNVRSASPARSRLDMVALNRTTTSRLAIVDDGIVAQDTGDVTATCASASDLQTGITWLMDTCSKI